MPATIFAADLTRQDLNQDKYMPLQTTHITSFCIAGINYKKTDADVRGQFAVNNEQYARLLQQAGTSGIKELFVVSTCNRTEIYGFAQDPQQLVQLLCS